MTKLNRKSNDLQNTTMETSDGATRVILPNNPADTKGLSSV